MAEIHGSGLAFPLRVDRRGALAIAREDEDVEQAIRIVLSTAPGERPMRPEFGCAIHDHLFDVIDARTLAEMTRAVRGALDRWEPRIDVLDVAFDLAAAPAGVVEVLVTYRLRTTNAVRNLVWPFYIVPTEEPA